MRPPRPNKASLARHQSASPPHHKNDITKQLDGVVLSKSPTVPTHQPAENSAGLKRAELPLIRRNSSAHPPTTTTRGKSSSLEKTKSDISGFSAKHPKIAKDEKSKKDSVGTTLKFSVENQANKQDKKAKNVKLGSSFRKLSQPQEKSPALSQVKALESKPESICSGFSPQVGSEQDVDGPRAEPPFLEWKSRMASFIRQSSAASSFVEFNSGQDVRRRWSSVGREHSYICPESSPGSDLQDFKHNGLNFTNMPHTISNCSFKTATAVNRSVEPIKRDSGVSTPQHTNMCHSVSQTEQIRLALEDLASAMPDTTCEVNDVMNLLLTDNLEPQNKEDHKQKLRQRLQQSGSSPSYELDRSSGPFTSKGLVRSLVNQKPLNSAPPPLPSEPANQNNAVTHVTPVPLVRRRGIIAVLRPKVRHAVKLTVLFVAIAIVFLVRVLLFIGKWGKVFWQHAVRTSINTAVKSLSLYHYIHARWRHTLRRALMLGLRFEMREIRRPGSPNNIIFECLRRATRSLTSERHSIRVPARPPSPAIGDAAQLLKTSLRETFHLSTPGEPVFEVSAS